MLLLLRNLGLFDFENVNVSFAPQNDSLGSLISVIFGSSLRQKMFPLLPTSRKAYVEFLGRVKCGILTLHMLRSQNPDLRRNKSYNLIKRCKCVVFCGFCGRNTPLLFLIFLSSP